MSRFSGKLGIKAPAVENAPGIYEEDISEIDISGTVFRAAYGWTEGEHVQNTLRSTNRISIVVSEYLESRVPYLVYVIWNNTKWSIRSVETARPRLIISLGGVYNE